MKLAKFLAVLAFLPLVAMASEEHVHLDKAPINPNDNASLQRGAKMFVNYCLSCHSASYMRYSRLTDIGLSEDQIKNNLLFASEKVGDTMNVAMRYEDSKVWFGTTPPDLSVIARSRGPDWIYTYLRSFYWDPSRPTGWNNVVFPKVGMPHVLTSLQGTQVAVFRKETNAEGVEEETFDHFVLDKPGTVSQAEFDNQVGDLVNYLTWMAEPGKEKRMQTGLLVMAFLGIFFIFAYYLKHEFWKDVH